MPHTKLEVSPLPTDYDPSIGTAVFSGLIPGELYNHCKSMIQENEFPNIGKFMKAFFEAALTGNLIVKGQPVKAVQPSGKSYVKFYNWYQENKPKIDALKADYETLKTEFEKKRIENQKLTEQNNHIQNELDRIRNSGHDSYTGENRHIELYTADLPEILPRKLIQNTKSEVGLYTETEKAHETAISDLKKENETLQKIANEKETENAELLQEIQDLKRQLNQGNSGQNNLALELQNCKQENAQIIGQYNELIKGYEAVAKTIKQHELVVDETLRYFVWFLNDNFKITLSFENLKEIYTLNLQKTHGANLGS